MQSRDSESRIHTMVEEFQRELERGAPFVEDRDAAHELAGEAGPVLEALELAWTVAEEDEGDPLGRAHEALALVTLLGRRSALAGLTPTAALAVPPALCAALRSIGIELPEHVERTLRIVSTEGYCAGRDDRHQRVLAESLGEAQRWLRITPRCFVLPLAGGIEPEAMGELGDRWAREMLRADSASAVVDTTGLTQPTREHARGLVSIAGSVETLGIPMWVVAAEESPWLADVEISAVRTDSLSEALSAAVAASGWELRERRWPKLFGNNG